MEDRSALERRLEELREALGRVEGGPTEVYSRIVGYYRSVRNWNAGKREEYAARRVFGLPAAARMLEPVPAAQRAVAVSRGEDAVAAGAVRRDEDVLVFTRAACPKCPPVANYVRSSALRAVFVDVDAPEGLELARRHAILATPTVLALDGEGREIFRACDVESLKSALGRRAERARAPAAWSMA